MSEFHIENVKIKSAKEQTKAEEAKEFAGAAAGGPVY